MSSAPPLPTIVTTTTEVADVEPLHASSATKPLSSSFKAGLKKLRRKSLLTPLATTVTPSNSSPNNSTNSSLSSSSSSCSSSLASSVKTVRTRNGSVCETSSSSLTASTSSAQQPQRAVPSLLRQVRSESFSLHSYSLQGPNLNSELLPPPSSFSADYVRTKGRQRGATTSRAQTMDGGGGDLRAVVMPKYRLRVVALGDSGSGKTSVLHALAAPPASSSRRFSRRLFGSISKNENPISPNASPPSSPSSTTSPSNLSLLRYYPTVEDFELGRSHPFTSSSASSSSPPTSSLHPSSRTELNVTEHNEEEPLDGGPLSVREALENEERVERERERERMEKEENEFAKDIVMYDLHVKGDPSNAVLALDFSPESLALSPFFTHKRSLVLLMYDPSTETQSPTLERWLKLIRQSTNYETIGKDANGPTSPSSCPSAASIEEQESPFVVLVGVHKSSSGKKGKTWDELQKKITKLRATYSNVKAAFFVDKSHKGLAAIQDAVAQQARRHFRIVEELGKIIPPSVLVLQEQLRQLLRDRLHSPSSPSPSSSSSSSSTIESHQPGSTSLPSPSAPFISWQEFETIAKSYGIAPKELAQITTFWSDTGQLLHINDATPRATWWLPSSSSSESSSLSSSSSSLQGWVFLDMMWMAALYRRLLENARQTGDSGGASELGFALPEHLPSIWPAPICDPAHANVPLMLLEKLQLLFYIKPKRTKVLMLDKESLGVSTFNTEVHWNSVEGQTLSDGEIANEETQAAKEDTEEGEENKKTDEKRKERGTKERMDELASEETTSKNEEEKNKRQLLKRRNKDAGSRAETKQNRKAAAAKAASLPRSNSSRTVGSRMPRQRAYLVKTQRQTFKKVYRNVMSVQKDLNLLAQVNDKLELQGRLFIPWSLPDVLSSDSRIVHNILRMHGWRPRFHHLSASHVYRTTTTTTTTTTTDTSGTEATTEDQLSGHDSPAAGSPSLQKSSALARRRPSWANNKSSLQQRLYLFLNKGGKSAGIPLDLLPQLVVRLVQSSGGNIPLQWRCGLLFSKDKSHALLELEEGNETLRISVSGKHPGKLWDMLHFHINDIAQHDHSLVPLICIPCTHCFLNQYPEPFLFSLDECQAAIAQGKASILCQHQKNTTGPVNVFLSQLVPDVSLAGLERYELSSSADLVFRGEIARGSHSIVRKAEYKGKEVAVKEFILPDNTRDNVSQEMYHQILREFRSEVILMSGLERHPHVVSFLGFCKKPLSLVMEFLPDGDLWNFLRKNKKLGWLARIKIALDIAKGMRFLHSMSPPVIHRDLKSANILMNGTRAKVSDFGLSTVHALTIKSRDVDNPLWLAPEIIKGEEASEKADIYSFGILLWEIATHEQPFSEFSYDFISALEDQIVEEGLRPTVPPNAPKEYAKLMRACWDADAKKRPSFFRIVKLLRRIKAEEKHNNCKTREKGKERRPSIVVIDEKNEDLGIEEVDEELERFSSGSNTITRRASVGDKESTRGKGGRGSSGGSSGGGSGGSGGGGWVRSLSSGKLRKSKKNKLQRTSSPPSKKRLSAKSNQQPSQPQPHQTEQVPRLKRAKSSDHFHLSKLLSTPRGTSSKSTDRVIVTPPEPVGGKDKVKRGALSEERVTMAVNASPGQAQRRERRLSLSTSHSQFRNEWRI
ncbi:Pleckstrin y domain [Balamuthia mandrillaris]